MKHEFIGQYSIHFSYKIYDRNEVYQTYFIFDESQNKTLMSSYHEIMVSYF